MFIIYKIANLLAKSNKCKYCDRSVNGTDTYCSFSCAINDNKNSYSENTDVDQPLPSPKEK